MTTSAFPGLTTAETIFKDLVWTPMLTAGENWIEAEVPILDLPVVKQLDEAALKALTDAIFNQICEVIDVEAIQLVNAAAQASYDSSFEQLSVIIQEKGVGSPEYAQAKTQALSALAAIGHISG